MSEHNRGDMFAGNFYAAGALENQHGVFLCAQRVIMAGQPLVFALSFCYSCVVEIFLP